jgi:excalibur calcium-binding domain-containing protein
MFQNLRGAARFSKPRLLVLAPMALAALVLPAGGLAAAPALVSVGQPAVPGAVSSIWQNCTSVHTRYAHGVGRLNARDHTRSGTGGVTTFKRSTQLYNAAMRYNSGLDGDKDGVACEKH